MAYTAPAWRDFAVTIGGLSGALTGLLFVAVSLHSGALARSRPLASRAAQTLVLFLTPAISAVVLAAPLPSTALGAVLLAVAAVSGVTLLWLDRRAGHDLSAAGRAARYIDRGSPNNGCSWSRSPTDSHPRLTWRYQPSSSSRSSSMPKWWATSWMTVRRTWSAT
jgi:hypothetical protein